MKVDGATLAFTDGSHVPVRYSPTSRLLGAFQCDPRAAAALRACCGRPQATIPDGAEVVVAFDGSFTGDTTVLTVATVCDNPHLDLVEL